MKNILRYTWKITFSTSCQRIFLAIYVLSLGACFKNALPWAIQFCFAAGISWQMWLWIPHTKQENWQLVYDEESGWKIMEDGATHSIEILPSSVINRFIIFLHYQYDGKRIYRLIAKDAIVSNLNDYRQLIVTLKTYQ